jgi:hypothetical protein
MIGDQRQRLTGPGTRLPVVGKLSIAMAVFATGLLDLYTRSCFEIGSLGDGGAIDSMLQGLKDGERDIVGKMQS